jgi:hypothetical protein
MSGSKENIGEESRMFQKGVLGRIRPDGVFVDDTAKSPWGQPGAQAPEVFNGVDTTRMYMSFIVQNQLRPSAQMTALITRMADSICHNPKFQDDYAYIVLPEARRTDFPFGILGYDQIMFLHGTSLRGLCRAHAMTGDPKYLELAGKFKNLLLQPKYWVPETAPKAVAAGEHGQFEGHMHSYTTTLMGLAWYSSLTNDAQVKEFVRESYQYLRTFGLSRIGMFGEMCMTGDMTWLAIKLSDMGVGDYWEDVDQYARNQLLEQQIADADKMNIVVATMPKLVEMESPQYAKLGATTDNVVNRNVGVYRSDASNPTLIRPMLFRWSICCPGNCTPAYYGAWEATVRYQAGVAQVNLLLNRVSPWLDMDSYLPYEGKVVIRNKSAQKLFVRIPRRVETDKVMVEVKGKGTGLTWIGRYLFIEGLRREDKIRIDFPMVEAKETYTLKWKSEDFWMEGLNPGSTWKPNNTPDRFTFHLKGNTVVDVTPRTEGPGYPLYVRDQLKASIVPMRQVTRYVSPTVVWW